jgi:hypothetical protein
MTPLEELQAERNYVTRVLSRALGYVPPASLVDSTLTIVFGSTYNSSGAERNHDVSA